MAAIGAIPLWAAGIAAPVVSPAIVPIGAGVTIGSVIAFAAVKIAEQVGSRDETAQKNEVVIEIEEAMKMAQIAFEIDIKDADEEQSPRARVGSGMWNAQPRTLKLYRSGSLSGDFVVEPPEYMFESPIFIGLFLHQGSDPDDDNSGDSKGYVIYGSEEDRSLLYILAWSKPAKGSPKVYVQAGLLPNMLKQPYNYLNKLVGQPNNLLDQLKDQIIQKLLNHVDELMNGHKCSSYDPETRAEAAAEIRSVYPGSSWALLGAKFSRREH